MVVKIKNQNFGHWTWLDNVDKISVTPCEIRVNRFKKEESECDYIIQGEALDVTFYPLEYYRWPLEIGDKVNVLYLKHGKNHHEEDLTILTEHDSVFILGSDGKTLDRI